MRRIGAQTNSLEAALLAATKSDAPQLRQEAILAWGAVAPASREFSTVAIALLKDPAAQVRIAAGTALGKCQTNSAEVVAALIASYPDAAPEVKLELVKSLGQISAAADAAYPVLIDAFAGSDYNSCLEAQKVLHKRGAEALPHVLEGLKKHQDQRRRFVFLLGQYGKTASSTAPLLIPLLRDPDDTVAWAAAAALGEIGGDEQVVVPALVEALDHEATRYPASQSLASYGQPAVDALLVALQDGDPRTRIAAAGALSKMGKAAVAAKEALFKSLGDADRNVRCAALIALASVGRGDEEVVSKIAELQKNDADLKAHATLAMVLAAVDPSEHLRVLLESIYESRASHSVPFTIHALQPYHAQLGDRFVPALVDMVKSEELDKRMFGMRVLHSLGHRGRPAASAIARSTHPQRSTAERTLAMTALVQIGATADQDLELTGVYQALNDPDPFLRSAASSALQVMERPRDTNQSEVKVPPVPF